MKKINFVFSHSNCDSKFREWQQNLDKLDYSMIHDANHSALFELLDSLNLAKSFNLDNMPDDIFFYEYNHHWWFPVERFFGENGFLENSPCPHPVIERVKNKTAFIIVTIATESPIQYGRLTMIHEYFKKKGLPSSQVIYFTCSPNANLLYEQQCIAANQDKMMVLDYIPYYPINTFRFHSSINQEYCSKPREKDILMFNRRWGTQPHRVLFLYQLFKLNLIQNSHVSFSKTEVENCGSYTEHFNRFKSLLPSMNHDQSIIDSIEQQLPLILDQANLSLDLMYDQFDETKSLYDNSFLHVISETNFFTDIIHITEKTFKPMVYKQPFIMLSSPYFLASLRDIGFKTFNTIWDESYDTELDHEKRFFMIVNLVQELCSLSQDEKISIMKKCAEIVEYNYNLAVHSPHNFLIKLVEQYGNSKEE